MSVVVGPMTLTFDLVTLKRVHGSSGWIMGFHGAKYGLPGPFSSRLKSRPGTDKLTDRRQPTLNTPFYGGRGIIGNRRIGIQVVSAAEVTFKRH